MSYTVFLGNLPVWVTKDDIKSWLNSENLVYDDVKVIRNPETQESKGFAFVDTPNSEEMQSIIRRFDRAPLEDRLLRANQAQPPKSKSPVSAPHIPGMRTAVSGASAGPPVSAGNGGNGGNGGSAAAVAAPVGVDRSPRRERGGKKHKRTGPQGPQSAFAEELAKAL